MLKKLCKSMSKSSVVFMLILTFSLIFASISYGWMATNRKVRGNGLEIISKTPDPCEVVSFQVLKKSAIDGSASCVCDSRWSTFNRSTAYFEMDAYDSIFDDNNDTTPGQIQ